MLFLEVFDAREEEWEMENDDYKSPIKSPIPKKLRWREWAADDEGITGDALLDFVNNELFPKLKGLSATEGQSLVVRSVFEDAYNYVKNGTLLRQVVNKLNECVAATPDCNLPHECAAVCETGRTPDAIQAGRQLLSCFGGCD